MTPTITAVVCAYWAPRFANVERIVSDLLAGTVVPDRILVLNNNPDHQLAFNHLARNPLVDVVCGSANHECRGKFIAALLAPADFYLMHDDDTSVGTRTVECLRRHAMDRDFVTGYWGVRLAGSSFMQGTIVQPRHLIAAERVDAFHGRAMFMGHRAIVRMLAAEEKVRLDRGWRTEGDDIIAGLANRDSSWCVPMDEDEAWVDLDQCGVAMQMSVPNYFAMRDEFTGAVLDALA